MRREVLDHLVEQLYEADLTLRERIEKKFAGIGINKVSLNMQAIMLGTFIVIVFEELRKKIPKLNSSKVSWKFMRRVGDILDAQDNYENIDMLNSTLLVIDETSMLNEDEAMNVSLTISIITRSIREIKDGTDANSFALNLLKIVKDSSSLYPADTMKTKKKAFKDLINLKKPSNIEESIELIRRGIEALPFGSRQMANRYLYYLVRIFGIWPNAKKYLEPPITAKMFRPIKEIGLIDESSSDLKESLLYLAKSMFPEDPALISVFDFIASKWCKRTYKKCRKCPLYFACPRLL